MTIWLQRAPIFGLLWAWIASAQIPDTRTYDPNAHLWIFYNGDHRISGPWGIHFDGQWRRSDYGTTWQQYQLRPGLNYQWSDNLLLTIGYAYTRAYPYGDYPVQEAFPEHRIYQQGLIRHSAGAVRFQHRIRMEQRFIEYPNTPTGTTTYQNRFRYLFRSEFPLKGTSNWYIPVYDEILIGIAPNYGARPFDQNRIFAGIGRSVGWANIEAGYMNQFLGQRNGKVFEVNNTLVITISSSAPFSKLLGRK